MLLRKGGKEHNSPITFAPMAFISLRCYWAGSWKSLGIRHGSEKSKESSMPVHDPCRCFPNWPLHKGNWAAIDLNSSLFLFFSARDCCRWCFLNEYIIWVRLAMDQSWSAFYSSFTHYCIDWCWKNCAWWFLTQVLRLQLPHANLWT